MKHGKKIRKVLYIIAAVILLLLSASYINHRIQLSREKHLLTPMGKLVEVNGNQMSLYMEGSGDKTLVFLSGGGTCSPILDFRSLYSLLSDDYRIVVVEKFGYGFSDITDGNRDIDTVLEDTRQALKQAEIQGPFILCAHSMSGIEALYWGQKYPGEVSAIIGLDMAVPEAYEDYKINMPMVKLGQYAAAIGLTRWIPDISESDAIKSGTLTDHEKEVYRALFYNRTATKTMINELHCIKESAVKVEGGTMPKVPMLLFVSNAEGTGWKEEAWKKFQMDFIKNVTDGEIRMLDCSHYVHDYEQEEISYRLKKFLLQFYQPSEN